MTPDQYTNQAVMVKVGDGHSLYVQDWGNKKAEVPIVFLHGGPGAGVKDKHRQQFDPSLQRVIFFDQRGCGKSTPYGSLEHNTTQELVEDIQLIVDYLKLRSFIITGGSWGSCLALIYAIQHPERLQAMVLRGIFTGRSAEIEWLNSGYFKNFFPDVWNNYLQTVPVSKQDNPTAYHFSRMFSDQAQASLESAYAYSQLEGALLSLDDRYSPAALDDFDPTLAKLEAHYMRNRCFLEADYIMDNAHKLSMPIWLIQGRYDMVCPPFTAYELHQRLVNSHLIWTVAGHGNDRANYDINRTLLLQMVAK